MKEHLRGYLNKKLSSTHEMDMNLRNALAETMRERQKERIHNMGGKCSFNDCKLCN